MTERMRALRELRDGLNVTLEEFDMMNVHLVGYLSCFVTESVWQEAIDAAAQSLATSRHAKDGRWRFSRDGAQRVAVDQAFSLDEPTALHASGEGEGL